MMNGKRMMFKLVLLCSVLICNSQHQEKESIPPNILFIAIDDLRPTLGVYGDTEVITPNIDKLASEGMTFMETYAQVAVCAPSRASLMTGLRPDATRVWHLGEEFRVINPEAVTMPQYFSK
ncbi:sulfatase-like hydrolase/transferase [Cellulophaga algicola]|uniref:sulfatase-like hydrolase/transferase n=1 Tax=Cellulophaga algicola TaxID=59600 RepID=UPI0006940CA1|nr:sulfatase-like hydrolase/transferase [Cellulophaga algicola]